MDGSGGKECSLVFRGLEVVDQWLKEDFFGVSGCDYPKDIAVMDSEFGGGGVGVGGWYDRSGLI